MRSHVVEPSKCRRPKTVSVVMSVFESSSIVAYVWNEHAALFCNTNNPFCLKGGFTRAELERTSVASSTLYSKRLCFIRMFCP